MKKMHLLTIFTLFHISQAAESAEQKTKSKSPTLSALIVLNATQRNVAFNIHGKINEHEYNCKIAALPPLSPLIFNPWKEQFTYISLTQAGGTATLKDIDNKSDDDLLIIAALWNKNDKDATYHVKAHNMNNHRSKASFLLYNGSNEPLNPRSLDYELMDKTTYAYSIFNLSAMQSGNTRFIEFENIDLGKAFLHLQAIVLDSGKRISVAQQKPFCQEGCNVIAIMAAKKSGKELEAIHIPIPKM